MPFDDYTERDIADDLLDEWIESYEWWLKEVERDVLDEHEPDDAEIDELADLLMGVPF